MVATIERNIIALLKAEKTRDEGFTLLMEKYQQRLYWHARRLVISHENAQDAIQETFINVYKYLHKFNEESSIYTWLFRITTNECIRIMKKQRNGMIQLNGSDDFLHHPIENAMLPEGDEMQLRFEKAVMQLPEKQRIVFNLRYFDEMDYAQMSEVLNTKVGALKTSYHYACERIKEILNHHN